MLYEVPFWKSDFLEKKHWTLMLVFCIVLGLLNLHKYYSNSAATVKVDMNLNLTKYWKTKFLNITFVGVIKKNLV